MSVSFLASQYVCSQGVVACGRHVNGVCAYVLRHCAPCALCHVTVLKHHDRPECDVTSCIHHACSYRKRDLTQGAGALIGRDQQTVQVVAEAQRMLSFRAYLARVKYTTTTNMCEDIEKVDADVDQLLTLSGKPVPCYWMRLDRMTEQLQVRLM